MISFFIVFVCSYLLGCISTGYYLVKITSKANIRDIGSRSTGATNVGRVLGKKGFIITFFVDFGKGLGVILICKYLQFTDVYTLLCGIALLGGHIWPVQLKFKGGKGISVMVGFFFVWNFPVLFITALLGLIVFLFIRRFTMSGLAGLLVVPLYSVVMHLDIRVAGLLWLMIGIIYFAHRDNIREYFTINFKTK